MLQKPGRVSDSRYIQIIAGELEAHRAVLRRFNVRSKMEPLYALPKGHSSLMILGIPGVGKTNVLYQYIHWALRAYHTAPQKSPLPVLLHLGMWEDEATFDDFLRHQWPLTRDTTSALTSGEVLLFLDGLDEIGTLQADKAASIREWLVGTHGSRYIIMTAGTDQVMPDVPAMVLNGLLPEQVRTFVTNSLPADVAEALLYQITSHDADDLEIPLQRLACIPLFLSALVKYCQEHQAYPLPGNAGAILQWLMRSAWERSRSNGIRPTSSGAELILGKLAFAMIEEDRGAYVPYVYAIGKTNAEAILKAALNAGVLVQKGHKIAFAHMLYRDYFAACQLGIDGVYTQLSYPQFTEDGRRLPWKWDNVVALLASIAPVPDDIVRAVAEVNPYLAAECIVNTFVRSSEPKEIDEDAVMPLKKLAADTARLLAEILRGEQSHRRRGAAWALGELKEPAAVPSLIEALGDENPEVRTEASDALIKFGKSTVPRLVEALKQQNATLRAGSIKVLGRLRDPRAIPALIFCLDDTSWPEHDEVRLCDLAGRALEQIGTQEAVEAVQRWRQIGSIMLIKNEDESAVRSTSRLVLRIASELRQNDWEKRRDAVRMLSEQKSDSALPYLITALKDEDYQVRWAAVNALAEFRGESVIAGLLTALRDNDPLVCDASSEALAKIGGTAVPGLLDALHDAEADVRGAAAEALGRIAAPESATALANLLNDTARPRLEEMRVCDIAAKALEKIGTVESIQALAEWQKENQQFILTIEDSLLHLDSLNEATDEEDRRKTLLQFLDTIHEGDWHTQRQAARSLREYAQALKGNEDRQVIEQLSNAVNDDESLVRWSAVEALAWIGNPDAGPALVEALHDPNWTVRVAAVRAMVEVPPDSDALVELVHVLRDQHPLVREVAAETLGRVGNSSVVVDLVTALSDDDAFVRRAAAESLGELRARSAIGDLLALLGDNEHEVKRAVVEALGKIGDPSVVTTLSEHLQDTSGPEWEERRMCDIVAEALEAIGTPQAQIALQRWRSEIH